MNNFIIISCLSTSILLLSFCTTCALRSQEDPELTISVSKFIENIRPGAKLIAIKLDKPQGLGNSGYLAVIKQPEGNEQILELFRDEKGEFKIIGSNEGLSGLIANIENEEIKASKMKLSVKLEALLKDNKLRESARSVQVTSDLNKIDSTMLLFIPGEGAPHEFNMKITSFEGKESVPWIYYFFIYTDESNEIQIEKIGSWRGLSIK